MNINEKMYIRRHLKFLMNKIELYKNKKLKIAYLIQDLEEIISAIREKEENLAESLLSLIYDIDIIYACFICGVEGRRKTLSPKELEKIDEILDEINRIVNNSKLLEYKSEEEFIQVKINECFED